IEDPDPIYVLDVDLTGKGIYTYSDVVDIYANPNEFYRFEVRSEKCRAGDDIGIGLSNPIWVYDSGDTKASTVSAAGFTYKLGGEVIKTANNRWVLKAGNFIPSLFKVDSDAAYTDVVYHKRSSRNFPDSVSVYMLAPDGKTSSSEILYIV
ncbi:MAG: hypothetical protein RSC55_08265, partial [Oscillospiraceae bacterium]